MGGALFNHLGTVTITNSTLYDNVALGGLAFSGAGDGGGFGGALFNLNGSVTLVNDTFDFNRVMPGAGPGDPGAAAGADVYNLSFGNSIANGSAVTATLTLFNNILDSGNSALVNNQQNGAHTNTARVNATGPNLLRQPAVNLAGAITGIPISLGDPILGLLVNNGGPTPTQELLPGSPALNAGFVIGAPATDQRGVIRGSTIDLGAYQATSSRLVLSGFPSPQGIGLAGSFTVTAVDPFGKTAFGYQRMVSFSASVPATLPPASSLTNGSGTFSATFALPGVVTLSASDGTIAGGEMVSVTGTLPSRVVLKARRLGKAFQFTAGVRGVPEFVPTGRVVFYDLFQGRRRRLGSAPLRRGGATLRTSLPQGRQPVLAVYAGNGTYAPSQTAVVMTA
jgi:hypothetical protein